MSKNKVLGKVNYSLDQDFVKLKSSYASKTIFLRKEVNEAFVKMCMKANEMGVKLLALSGARSFKYQKDIWERKWDASDSFHPIDKAFEVLEYTAIPGTSRHHWGTDIDVNSLSNRYFEVGDGRKIYRWLKKNAHKFGFYQVYGDKKEKRTGYAEEKWHWSYLPTAEQYLSFFNKRIDYDDLKGFKGDTLVKPLKAITFYVNGL
ncbi:M15 family metallopeptidase [Tenacibaculum sp.]|nr:M15 family metallopeptidase [Tenacibaculum sp.]